CPAVSNPTQHDLDRDGLGDACDDDIDGDGFKNDVDACPAAVFPGRDPSGALPTGGGPDSDGDGIADDCDLCPRDPGNDVDEDGVCGDVDNCPHTFNPLQEDSNQDGSGDACQPVVVIRNIRQDGGPTLEVSAVATDPNGDTLSGFLDFFAGSDVTLPNL